jgi:glycosyltransferase involved in cell wall biosynthesis
VTLLEKDGIAVRVAESRPRRYFAHIRAVAAAIRDLKPDVLHTHLIHADVIGYAAARMRRTPVISTVHGITGTGWKTAVYVGLDLWLLRRFDAVVCVSDELRDRLIRSGVPAARIHVIPNGHYAEPPLSRDVARTALGLPSQGACVGWVGRLSHEKGSDLLIDAVARIPGARPLTVLIGEGPERAALEAQVQSTGLQSVVRFVGGKPNAGSLLSAFDILALSSRAEAHPMIMLEAMWAGVPIVAFGVGSVPRVLDADSGWVVEPGDVAGFATAIQDVMARPEEAARRAQRAREILEDRYTVSKCLEQLSALYATVISRHSHRASTT